MSITDMQIKRENLNDKVEQALHKMLAEGYWQEGERLPAETELAESFGVSRLTVRAALHKLSTQGFVDIRPGDGTYAKKFSLRSYLRSASDFYITPEMLGDVFEFRSTMEIEALRLAVQNADEKDFAEMRKSCQAYLLLQKTSDLSDEEELKAYIEADLNFHYSVCRSSHNSLFALAFNAVRGAYFKYLHVIVTARLDSNNATVPAGSGDKDLHMMMLERIRARDFPEAERLFYKMIDYEIVGDEFASLSKTL